MAIGLGTARLSCIKAINRLLVKCHGKVRRDPILSWRDASKFGKQYSVVAPTAFHSVKRNFPSHISKPEYADTGIPHAPPEPVIKTRDEIIKITSACRVAKSILEIVGSQIRPGLTNEEIDDLVYALCLEYDCYPSPLNYSGFPKCVTTSVNNIAVHAIPDTRPLEDGDIISVDVSVYMDGFHGDCCSTFTVGDAVDEEGYRLIDVTKKSLEKAISICRHGTQLGEIGNLIESFVEENGFKVIPNLCGHGVGKYFHEPPQVLHYRNESSIKLVENMIITIEPVICEGDPDVAIYPDGWTISTIDGKRVAQFEDTILIQKNGAQVLTIPLQ